MNLLIVRPSTFDDLLEVTGIEREVLGNYLDILGKEGIVKAIIEERGIFYTYKK